MEQNDAIDEQTMLIDFKDWKSMCYVNDIKQFSLFIC